MKSRNILIIWLFPIVLFGQKREKMIIVSHFSFVPHLSVYADGKAADNIDCTIISVDSTDDFSSIKAKIDDLYSRFNADFLLLVGDNQHIPAYKMGEGLSDIHYCFDNEDNPRMCVGRFSVETIQDLQTMIDRSLVRKPFSKQVVGIGSYHKSELTQRRDYEQIRFMGEQLQSKGFVSVLELSGSPNGNPSYSDVVAALQAGASWLNYAGYGSYDGWNTSGFESRHIDSLPDDVELPVILSASCLGGHFANRTCFAEKWLRSTRNGKPIGAVAAIMSSSLTDWDATLSAMLLLCENAPQTHLNCRLGDLYLQGYRYIIDSLQRPKDAQCWILFGDPSLWIYPKKNENIIFQTDHSPTLSPIVYPNPTTGELRIANCGLPIETIEIYNIAGKLQNANSAFKGGNDVLIDVSHLPAGIYFLKIKIKDNMFVRKEAVFFVRFIRLFSF